MFNTILGFVLAPIKWLLGLLGINSIPGLQPKGTPISLGKYKRTSIVGQFLQVGADPRWKYGQNDCSLTFWYPNYGEDHRQFQIDWHLKHGFDTIMTLEFCCTDGKPDQIATLFDGDREHWSWNLSQQEMDLRHKWRQKFWDAGLQEIRVLLTGETGGSQKRWCWDAMKNADKFCSLVVPPFEQYRPLICTVLEVTKPGIDGSSLQNFANALAKYTVSPVGVHGSAVEFLCGSAGSYQIEMLKDVDGHKAGDVVTVDPFPGWEAIIQGKAKLKSRQPAVDWMGYLWGQDPKNWGAVKPDMIYNDCRRLLGNVRPAKKILFCEFRLGNEGDCAQAGLAAAMNDTKKSLGSLSGGPDGFGAFMGNLPVGMDSTRQGDEIILKGAGLTAKGNIKTGTFQMV